MEAILNVVLPVFAIILAGYLAGRLGFLGGESMDALNRFVYYVALPALLFNSMASVPAEAVFDWPFIASVLGGQAATFLACVLVMKLGLRRRLAEAGLFGMAAVFTNTGYMGIPLAMLAFGETAALPAIIATVINAAVVVGTVAALIEADLKAGEGAVVAVAHVAGALLRNPLLVAPVAGIALSLLGVRLPAPVATFCQILGAAAGPCALIAVGLFLVGKPIRRDIAEVAAAVSIKLLVHPALTWVLAFHVLDMPKEGATLAVLMAALPAGANLFVLAQKHGIYVQRASAAILLSTVLSVLTLSALLARAGTG